MQLQLLCLVQVPCPFMHLPLDLHSAFLLLLLLMMMLSWPDTLLRHTHPRLTAPLITTRGWQGVRLLYPSAANLCLRMDCRGCGTAMGLCLLVTGWVCGTGA